MHDRADDTSGSATLRGEAGADTVRHDPVGTTVRCAFPEEAAATLRISGATGSQPPGIPSQRFEDRGEIARGGMSTVHRVFDKLVLRDVAMKVLQPSRTFDELARFVEEVQITGQLDHPNIVPIHDLEMDEKGLPTRFTMKLVSGKTLQALLNESADRELLAEELEALMQIFMKVCDAVAFAHDRGVIHRDLKPGNIMIGSFGQVYVMDWGIATLQQQRPSEQLDHTTPRVRRAMDTVAEVAGTLSGTPSYMAPEQAQGRIADIDARTDVYGLGGILYSMLTCRPPHDGHDIEEDLRLARTGEITPPQAAAPQRSLPPLLCQIAMRALAADPSQRHASVAELKKDVELFLRGGGWFTQRHYAPNDVIVNEGDQADAAYIITAGECDLFKNLDGQVGQRRFVRSMGPGDVFGETAIFGSVRRTATIVAKTDVQVLVVTRAALDRELDRSRWLRSFVEALAQRFIEADRQVTVLTSIRPGSGRR